MTFNTWKRPTKRTMGRLSLPSKYMSPNTLFKYSGFVSHFGKYQSVSKKIVKRDREMDRQTDRRITKKRCIKQCVWFLTSCLNMFSHDLPMEYRKLQMLN